MASTADKRRWAAVLLALVLALITVLALAEGALRLGEWLTLRARGGAEGGEGAKQILCLGDSWTYGLESGDPSTKSYPARLQQLLNRQYGMSRFSVVNRGSPGKTSHDLASEAPELLKEFSPTVAVLLIGATNFFAIPEFTQGPDGVRPAPPDALGPLEQLRVVRVARMFFRPAWRRRARSAQIKLKAAFRDRLRQTIVKGMVGAGGGEGPPPVKAAPVGDGEASEDPTKQLDNLWLRRNRHPGRAWPADAEDLLNRLCHQYPGLTAAHRLKILAMVDRNRDACEIKNALKVASRACPACTWPGRVLKGLAREVDLPAGRLLWDNLLSIKRTLQQGGVRLFMLNYPRSDIDQCGQAPRDVIARFARAQTVPLLDIGEVLGSQLMGSDLRYYAKVDGHPNSEGYKRIALALQERLTALGWLK